MNDITRRMIANIFEQNGFSIILKSDETDLYKKNLTFKSGYYPSKIYVHRDTGIDQSGNMSYLKVAVHPDHFKLSPVVINEGIEEFINQKSKVNRHSSSNYIDFPIYAGND